MSKQIYVGLTQNSQQQKSEASKKLSDKIDAFDKAVKARIKSPTEGLPKNESAFLRWRGDNGEFECLQNTRSTLNQPHNARLKAQIAKIIELVKCPPITGGKHLDKNDERVKEQESLLEGLAEANHELELQIEILQSKVKTLTSERDRLHKNLDAHNEKREKTSSSVVELV